MKMKQVGPILFSLFTCGGFQNDDTETTVPYMWVNKSNKNLIFVYFLT